jgi:hypothetical protein
MLIFSWFLLKKALGMNIYIFLFYVQGEKEWWYSTFFFVIIMPLTLW